MASIADVYIDVLPTASRKHSVTPMTTSGKPPSGGAATSTASWASPKSMSTWIPPRRNVKLRNSTVIWSVSSGDWLGVFRHVGCCR